MMNDSSDRRSVLEWLLWGIWAVICLLLLQAALASSAELEPRAAAIFWLMFGTALLAGLVVAAIRRSRLL